MGFILSVSLGLLNSNALYPREDRGALARVDFYGRQLKGLILSTRISPGIAPEEVRSILGTTWNGYFGICGIEQWYCDHGVCVSYPTGPNFHGPLRVGRVQWRLLMYHAPVQIDSNSR